MIRGLSPPRTRPAGARKITRLILGGQRDRSMDAQSDTGGVAAEAERGVRYWWVKHKRTHARELDGEFLRSPKRKQSGADNESSHNMTRIMPGDVVFAFSFTGGALRAVGVA